MSLSRLSVASNCICNPVSMLSRRITFRWFQRSRTVCSGSSENTSTTNLSGGYGMDSGSFFGGIERISPGSRHTKTTRPTFVRCRLRALGNLSKGRVPLLTETGLTGQDLRGGSTPTRLQAAENKTLAYLLDCISLFKAQVQHSSCISTLLGIR